MSNEVIIEELNTLLRGTYMGIRSFEHYIQRVEDEELKTLFQSMQQEVKLNAQKLAERIQNLGGVPADGEGFSGTMHSYMHKVMLPDETNELLEDALKGLDHYGVQYSEELVRGDLDPQSRQLAEEVIDTSRKQIEQLRQYLQ
ncbi:PA2169 family four-helix-bundle protein [Neobacillus niacini]|jgi:bacterioferritin|uniref:PA2169 family four-helix-bundle protein n=1 Tax=Neobacillus niacini TaxID=86668 RepID=UPI001C8D6352|nr:PA2169 family four-helix-bundle protein [Neobacillus niacini]MBY0147377.1 PA2169 family four-helix-bundle protein [Neobacillus niacini]